MRTGRPRSNNRPEAASRSRNASAVSGRLPLWTMSSGFPLSARSTMSAAVASDTSNSTTGTNAVACGALRFRSWEPVGIPLVDREFLDRIDMLNAGIVDQNVDRPELGAGLIDHVFDLVGIGDVGAPIHHADIVLALEIADDFLDFVGRAKTVEHDIGALSGERGRDPKCDSLVEPVTMAVLPARISFPLKPPKFSEGAECERTPTLL